MRDAESPIRNYFNLCNNSENILRYVNKLSVNVNEEKRTAHAMVPTGQLGRDTATKP